VWEAPAHLRDADEPPAAERFPHVYGPIDRAAVARVRTMRRDAAGTFVGADD
jgi:uncharacterized protein (DUF952 family)